VIRVTVKDLVDDTERSQDFDDDYMIVTAGSCFVHHTAAYQNGTHVLTIKGRKDHRAPSERSK
jgi:hypothetical protein